MRRSCLLLAFLLTATLGGAHADPPVVLRGPQVVVALIDAGINPYSPAFRDDSALAKLSPSAYIPNYPPDCVGIPEEPTRSCSVRLPLTFTGATLEENLAADVDVWGSLDAPEAHPGIVWMGQLYYIPGTRIVGATSFGSGGRSCYRNVQGNHVVLPPPASRENVSSGCPERVLLDDMGHGTMTASRAAGAPHSLAPTARIVEIEGLGAQSSTWAANQPWIDVQSNSWGSLVPAPADTGTQRAFLEAARKQMVIVASGNGLGFSGVAPTPTELDSLGAPGVVLVGGHDNGRVTAWSGAPAHVVADAYAGYAAIHDSLSEMVPHPVACCTSAAAPYAAGGAAGVLLEARRILGDGTTGVRADGVVASGAAGLVPAGPLADGVFTHAEWKDVYLHTAQARPVEGRDDGEMNFLGGPAAPKHPEYGVGENPFCQGCFTLPLRWTDVPESVPAYLSIGYGAINEDSLASARAVLAGGSQTVRADVDEFFRQEGQVRTAIFTPVP